MPFRYSLPKGSSEPPMNETKEQEYIHVDSGATVVCTNNPNELGQCIPTSFKCGTAANNEGSDVKGLGTFGFIAQTNVGKRIKFTFSNELGIPDFKRISLSIHVLRDMGYDVGHLVTSTGSYLWIARKVTGKVNAPQEPMMFPLVHHNKADFLKISIVTGVEPATGEQPLHDYDVSAINLAQSLKGDQLYWLMHVRMGCPGVKSMKTMFAKQSVKDLTAPCLNPQLYNCVLSVSLNYPLLKG